MVKSAYVVAIGVNGVAGGYLLDGKSKQRLERFTREVFNNLAFSYGPQVTRGKIVQMPFTSLRKEIEGFEWYIEPCLSMRGIATAERTGGGKWSFTCELEDGTRVRHAAPLVRRKSHALVRENPVDMNQPYAAYVTLVEDQIVRNGYSRDEAVQAVKIYKAAIRNAYDQHWSPSDVAHTIRHRSAAPARKNPTDDKLYSWAMFGNTGVVFVPSKYEHDVDAVFAGLAMSATSTRKAGVTRYEFDGKRVASVQRGMKYAGFARGHVEYHGDGVYVLTSGS